MTTPLEGCWLKIERAKEHRVSLQAYITDTFAVESNRPRLGLKFERDASEYVLFVNHMPELSGFLQRCSIVLGDAVHNLISALDYLTYQLALFYTGGDIQKPNAPQFPIADTPAAFQEAVRRRLQEVAPAHVAIIERLQGYHRIDEQHSIGPYFHPLSLLRDLASVDKHRLPIELTIPNTGVEDCIPAAFNTFFFGVVQQVIRRGSVEPRQVILGAEVMRAKFPAGMIQTDMEMAGYLSPLVTLAEGDWPVVGVIDKIAAVVVDAISQFELMP